MVSDELELVRDVEFELLMGHARFEVIDGNQVVVGVILERRESKSAGGAVGWAVCDVPPPKLFQHRPPPEWVGPEYYDTPQLALEALANHRAWS